MAVCPALGTGVGAGEGGRGGEETDTLVFSHKGQNAPWSHLGPKWSQERLGVGNRWQQLSSPCLGGRVF